MFSSSGLWSSLGAVLFNISVIDAKGGALTAGSAVVLALLAAFFVLVAFAPVVEFAEVTCAYPPASGFLVVCASPGTETN